MNFLKPLVAIALLLGPIAASASGMDCIDPYFSELQEGMPLLGPKPGVDEGSLACLLVCYNVEERSGSGGVELAGVIYADHFELDLVPSTIDKLITQLRIVYRSSATVQGVAEECIVAALSIDPSVADELYHEGSRYSAADQLRLLNALNAAGSSASEMLVSKTPSAQSFTPVVLVKALQDGGESNYLREQLQRKVLEAGFLVFDNRDGNHLILEARVSVDSRRDSGYGMRVALTLSDSLGVVVATSTLASDVRVNQLTSQSRNTLVDWVMTGASEPLSALLSNGKRALLDKGGPSYRIEAGAGAGFSTEIMRELLGTITTVTVVSVAREGATVAALLRFPGTIDQLRTSVDGVLRKSYTAAQLDSPVIDSREDKILVH